MPLARISVPAHLDAARVQALADTVHEALVTTCAVPLSDRFQLIERFPHGAMLIDPTFGYVERTTDAVIVEITFLAGRSEAQKRALYATIARDAEANGHRLDDVMICLTENTPLDWSLGRGRAFDEIPHA